MCRSPWCAALALVLLSCGRGLTDSTPPLPLTAVARIDIETPADTLLLGDSLTARVRAVNREGTVLSIAAPVWSSTDSSVGVVSDSGVLRARNVGTLRLDAQAAGVVGTRTIRVVPRAVRVRLLAPDTTAITDDAALLVEVETLAGVRLVEVAPRLASADTTIARLLSLGSGRASIRAVAPGTTDLLAIIGRDTTRRRFVVRLMALGSLRVSIESRVVGLGDSVPFALTATDSAGRTVGSAGTVVVAEPFGRFIVRNGHLLAVGLGGVVVRATNGSQVALDTLTAQGPSEFPLDIVDGDGQNPLPLRVLLSMERVAAKWRRVLRRAPPGDVVRLRIGDCRNAVPVNQFISGVRVLVKLDTLPPRIAGQGGPCVVRPGGLPLLGSVSLNIVTYANLSDRKLDDLLQHEVGHVLGIGVLWGRGTLAGLIDGDSSSLDPIFVGPAALTAFGRLGRSARFTGRPVPLEVGVRGHWRRSAFGGELMAPALTNVAQPTSAVTVAALRDLGWIVEAEAYDEYALPDAVLAPAVSARVLGRTLSLEGDILLPRLMVVPGARMVPLGATGQPVFR